MKVAVYLAGFARIVPESGDFYAIRTDLVRFVSLIPLVCNGLCMGSGAGKSGYGKLVKLACLVSNVCLSITRLSSERIASAAAASDSICLGQ